MTRRKPTMFFVVFVLSWLPLLQVDREPAAAYGSVSVPQTAGGPIDAKPLTFDRLRRGLRCAVVLLRWPAFRGRWTNSLQAALRLLPRRGHSTAPRIATRCGRCRPSGCSPRSKAEPCSPWPAAAPGVERRAIAEFVTGKSFAQALSTTPSPQAMCRATGGDFANPLAGPRWNGWGVNTANTRYQDGPDGRIHRGRCASSEAQMGLRFSRRAQRRRAAHGCRRPRVRRHAERHRLCAQRRDRLRPLVFSGRRRRARGRQHRPHRDELPDRASRRSSATAPRTVYAVDAATGALLWKTKVDDFPFARVTGSPAFHNGRLYVGVASGEETAGAVADYECCRFRGSLVALNARDREHRSGRPTRSPKSRGRRRRTRSARSCGGLGRAHLDEPGDRRRSGTPSTSPPETTTAVRPPATATRSWPSISIPARSCGPAR